MPEPRTLAISEIFWSAQGEGSRCGTPSIFIRLAGCRVRCPYCDTRKAWSDGKAMTLDGIAGEVLRLRKRSPRSQIVLTGGEPLEQDITGLVAVLRQKKFFIAIETSGLYFRDLPIDWWTVSPKDVAGFRIHPRVIPEMDEVKLIVNRNLTLAVIRRIQKRAHCAAELPVFLQPQFFNRSKYRQTFRLFEESQRAGIRNVRLGFQLHAIYGIH
jgi:7-carboxy-7-deazaguanine synthase